MKNLITNVKLPGTDFHNMYIYGEASVEANKEMQEPLEKLYKYENHPDLVGMEGIIREYIDELGKEICRCEKCIIANGGDSPSENNMFMVRMETLQQVIYDLKSRLEENI
ncbi:hypothetical protein [uncultured Eubacterium sp.]|uniref:hypothetical protein n=1 Tax=uncultured Eubacterium sp. TaxID=165185 RepID=UPI00259919F8|nr:hypothetical protein [uncultured Eubacterium sp.]